MRYRNGLVFLALVSLFPSCVTFNNRGGESSVRVGEFPVDVDYRNALERASIDPTHVVTEVEIPFTEGYLVVSRSPGKKIRSDFISTSDSKNVWKPYGAVDVPNMGFHMGLELKHDWFGK